MITFQRLGHYGQLGNQMWQYAACCCLAAVRRTCVALPMRRDLPKKAGLYELGQFQMTSCEEYDPGIHRITRRFVEPTGDVRFLGELSEQPDGTDLHGYFQCYQYLPPEVCMRLVQDFQPRKQLRGDVELLLSRHHVTGHKLVAVNVRRDDYLQHDRVHMVLPAEYYIRAMYTQLAKCPNSDISFVVVSDDMPWCRENIRCDDAHVQYLSSTNHYQQFVAMSRCDGLIGSASSFSWWAAFLQCGGQIWEQVRGRMAPLFPDQWYGPDGPLHTIEQILPPAFARLAVKP